MDREVANSQQTPYADHWVGFSQAIVLARSGKLSAARQGSRRSTDLALQQSQHESAALYRAGAAIWESLYGNPVEAKQFAAEALVISKMNDVEYCAAVAYANAGEIGRAESLAADLEKRYPQDSEVRYVYLPSLRALADLGRNAPAKAVEALEASRSYDLGVPGPSFAAFVSGMYTSYLRGVAYAAQHKSVEALPEFQKVLDHPGIVLADPIGVLVHLQLARMYAAAGDIGRAKSHYGDFFGLLRNAENDVPILKQARIEYAKLP
jgi:hypothetical protein